MLADAREPGDPETAAEYSEESLAIFPERGNRKYEAQVLLNLGRVAREREQLKQARDRFADAADLFITIGAGNVARAITNVVDVCVRQGDTDAAREWCQRAIDFAERTGRRGRGI